MEIAEELLEVIEDALKESRREVRKAAKTLGTDESVIDKTLKDALLAEASPSFTQVWLLTALAAAEQPLPEMINIDGDELFFCEVRSPVPAANLADVERLLDGRRGWSETTRMTGIGSGSTPKTCRGARPRPASGEQAFRSARVMIGDA